MNEFTIYLGIPASALPGQCYAEWNLHGKELSGLISFAYAKEMGKVASKINMKKWCLDSGAFSAWNIGKPVTLESYCHFIKEVCPTLPYGPPCEIYALDVIGDYKASLLNAKKMWSMGIPAIPTFHQFEPWDILKGIARDYPKIAIGGIAQAKGDVREKWIRACFEKIWPCRVHGFGVTSDSLMRLVPFESVDSTSWHSSLRYASYTSMKRLKLSGKGIKANQMTILPELKFYLRQEREIGSYWHRTRKVLYECAPSTDSSVEKAAH